MPLTVNKMFWRKKMYFIYIDFFAAGTLHNSTKRLERQKNYNIVK